MVSGFLTSPYDQDRISSGEAIPILILENILASAMIAFSSNDGSKRKDRANHPPLRSGWFTYPMFLESGILVGQAQRLLAAPRGGLDGVLMRVDVVIAIAQVNLLVLFVQYCDLQPEALQLVHQDLER